MLSEQFSFRIPDIDYDTHTQLCKGVQRERSASGRSVEQAPNTLARVCSKRDPDANCRMRTVQFDSYDYKYRSRITSRITEVVLPNRFCRCQATQPIKLKLLFKFQFLV